MRRREFISLIGGAAAWATQPHAEESSKLKRVGFLRVGPPPGAWIDALRRGLRDLGYIEGRNLVVDLGLAPSVAQLPALTEQLTDRKADVIFASGTPPLLATRDAAINIPVVFVAAIDPVATAVVASLSRPGGNITGFTNTQADITAKHLELLSDLLPAISRIVLLIRGDSQASVRYVQEAKAAAKTLAVDLQILSLRDPGELAAIVGSAREASAVVMTDDAVFTANRARIADLAIKNKLPVISSTPEFVKAGGLISYGPDTTELYRRAADYVARILGGTKPSDLPVQQPTKFQLAINLKTAQALGRKVPPMLLARADEVIE
jgi:putative ABC transport system substrate-binding protein